ncbi:acyl-CoA dehydrogenase family protein [Pseudonocardia spinosispora]|uniref:acyl-CoA dehydrogenase family protein n=1 Tax=Pseudonocardia spinosispora TaxID=103441 RepID=UPI000409D51F|nr:acyl-CoA dehydrogenase family protein [Pseudonocardia spinosispora]
MSHTATESQSPEHYLPRVQTLAPVLTAAAGEEEDRRELPRGVVAALREAGLFHMLLPRRLGGGELGILSYLRVVEEIAKHDASAAWCINQSAGCSMVSGYLDHAVARDIFGKPDGVLAWGPDPGGHARAVEGGYIVNYSGQYASGSRHATWLGAHCLVDEPDGTPRRNARGEIERRTVLYPKSQAEMKDVWHVMGLRGTGSDSFVLRDLFVPAAYTCLRDVESEQLDSSPIYRLPGGMVFSSGFACVALGIARTVVDSFLDLAQNKTRIGIDHALRDDSVVQSEVAQCEGRLRAARLYLRTTVAEVAARLEDQMWPTLEQRVALRLASTYTIHQAKEAVDIVYDAAGASAIFESHPFERRFRDIHTLAQQAQGRKAHFEDVGKYLLGLDPRPTFL